MANNKRIYIFGAGGAGKTLFSALRNNVTVLAFIDNDTDKEGTVFCGKPVILPADINHEAYDYIVIASSFHRAICSQLTGECNVDADKIINVHGLVFNYSFKNNLERFSLVSRDIECIVTGISYAMLGVSEKYLNISGFNFSNNGQDLYYAYKIAEHVIKNFKMPKLKYWLIGLTYFSFHYDLSLRKDNFLVSAYSKVLNDFHHAGNVKDDIKLIESLLCQGYDELIYSQVKHLWDRYFSNLHNSNYKFFIDNSKARKKIKSIAKREFSKDYPKTVKENTSVLKDFISLLKDNNIKPAFFIVPGHRYYIESISEKIETEFHEAITDICNREGVPMLDCLRSPLFSDEHFYDDSHLNPKGAKLFTRIINDFLSSALTVNARADADNRFLPASIMRPARASRPETPPRRQPQVLQAGQATPPRP